MLTVVPKSQIKRKKEKEKRKKEKGKRKKEEGRRKKEKGKKGKRKKEKGKRKKEEGKRKKEKGKRKKEKGVGVNKAEVFETGQLPLGLLIVLTANHLIPITILCGLPTDGETKVKIAPI